MKLIAFLMVILLISSSLWALDEKPKILGQNSDGTLKGILMEQKIGCGPRSCLTNFWQDLNADGWWILSLYMSCGKVENCSLLCRNFSFEKPTQHSNA